MSPDEARAEALDRLHFSLLAAANFVAGLLLIVLGMIYWPQGSAGQATSYDRFLPQDPGNRRLLELALIAAVTGLGSTGLLLRKKWGMSLGGLIIVPFMLMPVISLFKILGGHGQPRWWGSLFLFGWYPVLILALTLTLGRRASALRKSSSRS